MMAFMAPPEPPILVVDDDPKIVALVRTYLERERYPVVTAADGHAALRAIEEHRPRLVVLDLMLPGLDGRPVPLSALELRLLATLLDADGRALTRDQLLDGIHGAGEGDVLDRAIDVYVKRLREKLGDDANAPRYVATVRGVGYRAAGRVERRRVEATTR